MSPQAECQIIGNDTAFILLIQTTYLFHSQNIDRKVSALFE